MPKVSTQIMELIQYYKDNEIKEYPTNKNKLPDMRKHFNKYHLTKLQKQKEHEIQIQKDKINIESKLRNYQEDKIEECIICYEKMNNNISILPCGHTCCVSCLMQHARENNNCPTCRKELCIKPKKIEKMPEQVLSNIISREFSKTIEERNGMSLRDYIRYDLMVIVRKKNINIKEVDDILNKLLSEIYHTNKDVGNSIIEWYS